METNDIEQLYQTPLPRETLREPAFRRFEPFLARGCHGTVVIRMEEVPGMKLKPKSFITRFLEARLGFQRYGYESSLIPPGYDLNKIKISETHDGKVMLSNPEADKMGFDRAKSVTINRDFPTDGTWEFKYSEGEKVNRMKQMTVEELRKLTFIRVIVNNSEQVKDLIEFAEKVGVVNEFEKAKYKYNPVKSVVVIYTQE